MKRFAAGADSTLSQTVWTRDPPPSGTWANQTTTASSWPLAAPPFATWGIQSFDQTRVTESGARRVIEQGSQVVRIIERYRVTWNLDAPASGAWTQGEVDAKAT